LRRDPELDQPLARSTPIAGRGFLLEPAVVLRLGIRRPKQQHCCRSDRTAVHSGAGPPDRHAWSLSPELYRRGAS
jgi:hypothetical protein